VISRLSGWEILTADFAKVAMPVIQPDLAMFVRKRLLDNDVGRAVPINIQGQYCQRGLIRFEAEISIPVTREMKLYGPEAALRLKPAIIDK
jgi:hypothetical protein